MNVLPICMNRTNAAKFLGVHPATLDKWTRAGKLTAHKMGEERNATVLYATADLYALIGLKPDGSPLSGRQS